MPPMKAVLQLSIHEERIRKKAFVTVSRYPGVASISLDDKTGKMTIVGEVDVSAIVMKLRKLCNTEIVSVEVVKPPEKKAEPEKKPEAKPAEKPEVVAWPIPMNYHQYQYNPAYANSYYQPQGNSRFVGDEPGCVIM
ncbi:PREDICTED: uncharacterized protein LOC104761284 [Camelina sativa]|uniref:Uncharacterized protein LOC104761284 n=1 Tax=Camelina sativa TaxID=90675 RepID=A0ABM0X9F2_CAMSA|nr:PREDICTED: uncharacterized protein LOC104761284 [Camelina sativa]